MAKLIFDSRRLNLQRPSTSTSTRLQLCSAAVGGFQCFAKWALEEELGKGFCWLFPINLSRGYQGYRFLSLGLPPRTTPCHPVAVL